MKCFEFHCKLKELQLLGTLNGGQSFRWKKNIKDGIEQWVGVFKERVWVLEQSFDTLKCQVYQTPHDNMENNELELILRNYFQLDLINLEEHYEEWSAKDPYFKEAAKQFYGIRILQQEPVENIFSFICSQNNHISRITSMVEKLASFYGSKICDLNRVEYYSFPKLDDLAHPAVEEKLRTNGFGYRAKYITKAAQEIVSKGGTDWLEKLKLMDYVDAKKNLITLTGIGPKVADCICLMSLGHLQAIPVDTHMYQIAARLYIPTLSKKKTITESIYKEIGDHFRNLYGPLAGWTHTILFCADLKKFKEVINDDREDKPNKRKKK
ncbi:hypothetical protein RN001_000622 [Aquatica leii]|uniref:N-glycosylase/DNA lyase n=1 Tax=Aquatica leii TaxID=1421715 RepID=A0AAN7PKD1_9COLE|nr:hypothetical protein RN001_000622 [Aquatica leii]